MKKLLALVLALTLFATTANAITLYGEVDVATGFLPSHYGDLLIIFEDQLERIRSLSLYEADGVSGFTGNVNPDNFVNGLAASLPFDKATGKLEDGSRLPAGTTTFIVHPDYEDCDGDPYALYDKAMIGLTATTDGYIKVAVRALRRDVGEIVAYVKYPSGVCHEFRELDDNLYLFCRGEVKEEKTPRATAKATPKVTRKPSGGNSGSKPTKRPTEKPTEKPTARPTERPTATPTAKPTATPTPRPTATPRPTTGYTMDKQPDTGFTMDDPTCPPETWGFTDIPFDPNAD